MIFKTLIGKFSDYSKFGKGHTISKANYGFLNSPKKQTKLTSLCKEMLVIVSIVHFLGELRKLKFAFEIYRPLIVSQFRQYFQTNQDLDSLKNNLDIRT